jgi:hypothetical protein
VKANVSCASKKVNCFDYLCKQRSKVKNKQIFIVPNYGIFPYYITAFNKKESEKKQIHDKKSKNG